MCCITMDYSSDSVPAALWQTVEKRISQQINPRAKTANQPHVQHLQFKYLSVYDEPL